MLVMALYIDIVLLRKWIGTEEAYIKLLGWLIVLFKVIFLGGDVKRELGLCIYMYRGCVCAYLELVRLILVLWYINMIVITHGADYEAWFMGMNKKMYELILEF